MTIEEIFSYVKKEKGNLEISLESNSYIRVKHGDLVSLMSFIKSDENLSFDLLECISAVDKLKLKKNEAPSVEENRFEIVYHLFSTKCLHRLTLKTSVPDDGLKIPSVVSLYPAANWHEREIYDLFGIEFTGHPFLRRILLPDDWEGYPLRKDYEYPKTYRDIPLV